MERPNILILINLDSIYPSMYDLFNQNFTVVSNKNYARLAIGSNSNIFTYSYINDEFRCIVSVDNNKINENKILTKTEPSISVVANNEKEINQIKNQNVFINLHQI